MRSADLSSAAGVLRTQASTSLTLNRSDRPTRLAGMPRTAIHRVNVFAEIRRYSQILSLVTHGSNSSGIAAPGSLSIHVAWWGLVTLGEITLVRQEGKGSVKGVLPHVSDFPVAGLSPSCSRPEAADADRLTRRQC